MATQATTSTLGSWTDIDSELLALQIAQQNQATATALSGAGGQGNTIPVGSRGSNPTEGGGGGDPPGGRGGQPTTQVQQAL